MFSTILDTQRNGTNPQAAFPTPSRYPKLSSDRHLQLGRRIPWLGMETLKDGVPWVIVTQGAVSSEVNKGCIQVGDSLQTRAELIFYKNPNANVR